jgi:hypothetical protein
MFQMYKKPMIAKLPISLLTAISARKRRQEDGPKGDFETDICSSPAFDPNRALLRRVLFLNEERTKYISVAFYPAQGYAAHVEFGAAKAAPIRLTAAIYRVGRTPTPPVRRPMCQRTLYFGHP